MSKGDNKPQQNIIRLPNQEVNTMRHIANDGTIFDKIEDCLRYEGSCEAKNNKNNDWVLWLLGFIAVVGFFAMRGM